MTGKYYLPLASQVAEETEQEKPNGWADGCEDWIELLRGDPEETLKAYLREFRIGHSK